MYIYHFIIKGYSKGYKWMSRQKRGLAPGAQEEAQRLQACPSCSPNIATSSPAQRLSEPSAVGIWWGLVTWAHSVTTPCQPFSLPYRMGRGLKRPGFWSWLVLCSGQPSPRSPLSHPIKHRTLLPSRKLQGFQESCVWNREQRLKSPAVHSW